MNINIIKSLYKYLFWLIVIWLCLSLLLLGLGKSEDDCLINKCGVIISFIIPPFLTLLRNAVLGILLAPILLKALESITEKLIEICGPVVKKSHDAITNEIGLLTRVLKRSIDRDGVSLFSSQDKIDVEDSLNQILRDKLHHSEASFFTKSNSKQLETVLKDAQSLIDNGEYSKAIELYKDILKNNNEPEIHKILLSTYSTVLDLEDANEVNRSELLKDAEAMLSEYGEPIHYVSIAYNFWENGDLDSALRVSKLGHERYIKLEESEDGYTSFLGLKNSFAYYIAELGDLEGKELAFELIDEAISYWKNVSKEQAKEDELIRRRYANCLDTQGFVGIVYSESMDELIQSYHKCQRAHKMGIDQELFLKHTYAYHKRMGDIVDVSKKPD